MTKHWLHYFGIHTHCHPAVCRKAARDYVRYTFSHDKRGWNLTEVDDL